MMTTNKGVAEAFARHESARAEHMSADGVAVFSYGSHFPIAVWLGDRALLWNVNRYSVTTMKQKALVLAALPYNVLVIERSTEQLQEFLRGGRQVIRNVLVPASADEALRLLGERLRQDASPRRVPSLMRKVREMVQRFLVVEQL